MTGETKSTKTAADPNDASGGKGKSGDLGKAVDEAKGEAKAAAGKAKAKAGSVAKEAKNAAAAVKAEAGQAAREVAGKARGELQGAIEEQKLAGAERAERIAGAIDRAADELGAEIPFAGNVLHRAAEEIEGIAAAVRDREPRELAGVVQDFARRQPAMFAGAVGLVGFAAMRFWMSSSRADNDTVTASDDRGDDADQSSASSLPRSALAADGTSSGDPGGVSPAAPGFADGDAESKRGA